MSGPEHVARASPRAAGRMRRGGRRGTLALAIGILVALTAVVLPVLRVVQAGPWLAASLLVTGLVLAVGVVARRLGVPALAVTLAEVGVWTVALTAMFFGHTAWVGIIPSPETFAMLPGVVDTALQEIAVGAAPLEATAPLSFFIAAATGALALVLDHVVVTTRMPLLGAVALVAVALIPTIVVPAEMDVFAFVLLAAAILFLMRTETRTRQRPRDDEHGDGRAAPSVSAGLSALAIGAVAVVVALVVTPILPEPDSRAGIGAGGGAAGIDPTLRLGDDLRRPDPVEVLRLHTSASRAPYLRAVTLSGFDGSVWEPDGGEPDPIGSGSGFGAVATADGIDTAQVETFVEIEQLSTPYLPVPFPATAIGGLDGDWGILAFNRTVVGDDESASGQEYEVLTDVPAPTLAQIRAASARGADVDPALAEVPDETPDIVRDLAVEVTAGTSTDYDAVAALQRWFRSSAFRYSLDAPVEDGFDGSGAGAVARFLEVREGYCVHFASAFALMARTLGIPTRIVVGYLPGAATAETVDDDTVYSVTSDLLHAWPEVYFEGIGWVGFEPTNSLGVPPTFSSGAGSSADALDESTPSPTASTPSSEAPSAAPSERADTGDAGAVGGGGSSGAAWTALLVVVLVLLALAAPGVARELWRRVLLRRARRGDVRAAWTVVQDTAIDLGLGVPASESPRAFGARLVSLGAPAEAMGVLVRAIEWESYAPAGQASGGARARGAAGSAGTAGTEPSRSARRAGARTDAASIADAGAAVRAALLADAPARRRLLAQLAPRSLVVRPGSAAAGAGARAGAGA